MTGVQRPAAAILAATTSLVAVLLILSVASQRAGASHAGGMDAMSIDMDPTGNMATSLGTRQNCGEVTPGGAVMFDVTALNIPPYSPSPAPFGSGAMIGFSFEVEYDESALTIESQNIAFLIGALPGSNTYSASQFLPDTDGSNQWISSVADINGNPPASESGSGVLSRLTISAPGGAPTGYYGLHLKNAVHLDVTNTSFAADQLNDAVLAVGVSCAALPPITPTPVSGGGGGPPSTPLPTPPPGIGPMQRMDIDVNPSGSTANFLGSRDACVEAAPGDQVTIDLTATGVPELNGATGFAIEFLYPESAFSVQSFDLQFFLAQNLGSTLLNGGQLPPDTNGDNVWQFAAADTSSPPGTPEFGNGVLTRVTVAVDPGAPPGQHLLAIGPASAHINAHNTTYVPLARGTAFIAVGVPCDVDSDGVPDDDDGCVTYHGLASNAGCPIAGAAAVGGSVGLVTDDGLARSQQESSGGGVVSHAAAAVIAALLGGGIGWWIVGSRGSRRSSTK